ncbi:MAG TPA: bifunctional oligoribonuclease/PAP phosphatase NrnA [Deltaproteobacteria bacterium]|jgi:phosphoesterase RecJ-like protein|nr:bifunctional oligoribonuclease/PAP phosphatase NrnA [Deltaproteobacteria bacterium]HON61476.1 bifunctional oligoribonuclease/PAP phosphatase NrnA [Deltaproteobacteria bacterium]HPL88384.1 bifunctional oligoribonuclease/PAP phosphatase NrnA [Deltaproteobacteria bacterium]HPV30043.1 bifunctional oligoribonuclease/PAP phosphatase NrnA [Deltaproteobacteria bacterium]HQQ15159.1 bifunctional oligoribonuclease/PAP phosphatase NrnA [Deltaproteobacteria bacterium]
MKNQIADIIHHHDRFEIITHEGPDEDAVGSSRALAHALNSLGKSVRLIYPTPIPEPLLFTAEPRQKKGMTPEISILLDVSDVKMLGGVNPQGTVVVIDHHRTQGDFGSAAWIDPQKSSASEMVYDLIQALGVDITPAIASNIYMGIFGDTGGFIHSNTTPRVFRAAYELTKAGADPNQIAYRLKRTRSVKYYHILCMVIDRLVQSGRIFGSYIRYEDLGAVRATPDDASGIVEELASLSGAEMVVFLRELNPDTVHGSIRSKSADSALKTARAFGGGGHGMAAGFTQKGRADELIEQVIEEGLKWVSKV